MKIFFLGIAGTFMGNLAQMAKNQGHEVCIIVPNSFPNYLSFIPNSNEVIIFDQDENKAIYEINKADTFFFLDFNDYCRIDLMESHILKNNGYKIMIDHHQSPSILADQVFSDTTICSTAELVYEFLNELDLNLSLNAAIALYTGIVTDSGSFKYNLVSSRTHLIISNLLSYNINHSEIHKNLYADLLYLKKTLQDLMLSQLISLT